MAQEHRRHCGYRKVGGLYLVASGIFATCDRLPMPLHNCPTCGGGIHFSRGVTKIEAQELWGMHTADANGLCKDDNRCHVCNPPSGLISFLMTVGEKYYTPENFVAEAQVMGVSKRIPTMPRDLVLGKSVVYLAHPEAVTGRLNQDLRASWHEWSADKLPLAPEGWEYRPPSVKLAEGEHEQLAVFCSIVPERVEKLLWKSQATEEEVETLLKRGITPVLIEDGDKDHA